MIEPAFDVNQIDRNEYQAALLKNETSEVKLNALKLCGAEWDDCSRIVKHLGRISHVSAFPMIIADTMSVNTGRKCGVLDRLERMYMNKQSRIRGLPRQVSRRIHYLC